MVAATADEVAAALAGTNQPISRTFRYTRRLPDNSIVEDISTAVRRASIRLDNNRSILRDASFDLDATRLPADFADADEFVSVEMTIQIAGRDPMTWQLGLFQLDLPEKENLPLGNQIWTAPGSDLCVQLFNRTTPTPYTVVATTSYVAAAKLLIEAVPTGFPPGPQLLASIPDSGIRTPVDMTWPPGTVHGQIVNDLMAGVNMFPVWATVTGLITSRDRGSTPHLDARAVTYSTLAEPFMVIPPFKSRANRQGVVNRWPLAVQDPAQTPYGVTATNTDIASLVSTQKTGRTVSASLGSADRIANVGIAQAIATYEVRMAEAKALTGTLVTLLDPRRDAHETYGLIVEATRRDAAGGTVQTPEAIQIEGDHAWRVDSWEFPCETDGHMSHNLVFPRGCVVDIEIT